jgi:polyhydroxybutyrate depolymerase
VHFVRLVTLASIALALPAAAQAGGAKRWPAVRVMRAMAHPVTVATHNSKTMVRMVRTGRQKLTTLRTEAIRTVKRPQELARLMARGATPGEIRFVHAHASDPRSTAAIDRTGSIHFGPRARRRLASGKRVKALLVAHGYTSNGDQQRALDDLTSHADAEGMAVVYIDGVEAYDRSLRRNVRSWNAGTCCGPAVEHGFRDIEYISELLPELGKKFFISGWAMAGESNGGFLTYKARRALPHLIHAAFPVVATEEIVAAPSSSRLPPVHATVGARDMLVNPVSARLMGALAPAGAVEQAARENGASRSRTRRVTGAYFRTTWVDAAETPVGSLTEVRALGFDHHLWPGGEHTSRRIARLAASLIPDDR